MNVITYCLKSENNNSDLYYKEIGVVGVACVFNLLEGGWRAKNLNFVPQCVILDYCGCKNHWHKEGIQTDINIRQLKRVLKIS